MRTKTSKRLLGSTTALLSAGAAAVVILGLLQPIDVPDVEDHPQMESSAVSHAPENIQQAPDLASLQKLARKDIRQRLFDPPPKPKPVTAPKPPPPIRLLGTIVNTTNSQAMVAGPGGQVEFMRVGDTVGDAGNTAVIRAIHADHITIEYEGKPVDVAIVEDTGRSR